MAAFLEEKSCRSVAENILEHLDDHGAASGLRRGLDLGGRRRLQYASVGNSSLAERP